MFSLAVFLVVVFAFCFACVMCSFMLVDGAVCSRLLAPLIAGASRPLGLLRELYGVAGKHMAM